MDRPRLRPYLAPRPGDESHIKCKRVREIRALRRFVLDLEQRVAAHHGRRSLLPWVEVATALAAAVADQRNETIALRQQLRANDRICKALAAWVDSRQLHTPPCAFAESWRDATLFAGDESARRIGCQWIMHQVYASTAREMHRFAFPNAYTSAVEIDVVVTPSYVLEIHGMTQLMLPYSLEEVSHGFWLADKTFVQVDHGVDTHFEALATTPDLAYAQEDMGPADQTIVDRTLYGRFYEDDKVVIVMRSVLHDAAFPVTDDAWTVDTRQWVVAERVNAHWTRLRTYYRLLHPCTRVGFVPIQTFAQCVKVHSTSDDDAARQLQDKFKRQQRDQRRRFEAHLHHVLARRRASRTS
ncbi:hypothetical protein SPRG_10852 [Saprolegnia parasitica CBS 223.65]|uniref:Uncharacterized protein n=1 Tax=Saprolegnia parasitica (strain CBS 223.65) TaxID=695850 RepID=A0A067C4J4_SAPPC|nr:hypothetical protein SPRG_10852 [Saprolegnia parasitica CBS 223.65]KDO24065.1 hypothetical protein SPRG_10852 [Saprolegnia parasitica CBS 223.65]|eukprot:XP_012205201.1 hypothetical protein SPRG_10852 [Saprolegnia parasitica CBS 223.65]